MVVASDITTSPGSRLRAALTDSLPCQIMGAFDGLSARIAADTGFGALWASGLCMSTTLGVRDSDEASWTELLNVVASIVGAADLPVLVDGDTGYGNFNTARRFVARAERFGVAGVCLEDKTFPKMNSFVGDAHQLAPVGEFCGKIEACKEVLRDPCFMIVARVEALIAGAGIDEALSRADAYCKAGADAIFIHSKQPTISEIAEFAESWGARLPLIICPTTYYATPATEFERLGIGGVIWANQSMRAAVSAIKRICETILAKGAAAAEPQIASLDDVFALMRYSELATAESRFGSGRNR
jgi:phosphoenolpyruvate phosphomutase